MAPHRPLHDDAPDRIDRDEALLRGVAHELHDDVGQLLIALRQAARALAADGADRADPERHERLIDDIAVLADAALGRLRLMSRALHPLRLQRDGLPTTLADLCANAAPGGEPEVVFAAPDRLPRGDATCELALYRIAQQAVANAIRHAEAARIHVGLSLLEGDGLPPRLQVSIADDGTGHDVDAPPGFGRSSMRERAMAAGGGIGETSEPGATRVVAWAPLRSGGA